MIQVEKLHGKSIFRQRVEIVERKGLGHPDYICDAVMDSISVALCKEYLKHCGEILHHNIDKGLLAAGVTKKKFGGGRVVKPMALIIGDRATFGINDIKIPVKEIAVMTAKKWLRENLRFVDSEKDVRYRVVLAVGSEELTDIFSRPGKSRGANDTSAAVGYYPLSPTEQIVLELERRLNSKEFKEEFPETGEDVKVMGLRNKNMLDVTICMPLLSRYVSSVEAYFERKKMIYRAMLDLASELAGSNFKEIKLHYNTLDRADRGIDGLYLSLLGTSAEDADSGQVGRGNRVNGLISMNRPMGTEAAAGKNPVSHVGKIYNLLAHQIAKKIYQSVEGVEEVFVLLLSEIGQPIDQPKMANVQIRLQRGQNLKNVRPTVEQIFAGTLKDINNFCLELAGGKYHVC
jgi:S-adenosylmethionine synthetase